MKDKKKKIVLAIVLIIILGIISYFFIDSYLFNKKEIKPKNYAYITYIVTDYDKTKNSNFSDISTYANEILNYYKFSEVVEKKGNYYEAIITGMNEIAFKNISKVTFGINNMNGEVIDDAKYDKKTRKISIPKKYFENEEYSKYNGRPVRLEIVSRVKKEEYKKNIIPITIKKNITKKINMKTNTPTEKTKISIFKYGKGTYISKNDIKVYANNSIYSVESSYYDYDAKTGILTINCSPLYLNNIVIKIKKVSILKNSLFNIFHIKDISADENGSLQDLDKLEATYEGSTPIEKVKWKQTSAQYSYIYTAQAGKYYYSFDKVDNTGYNNPYYHGAKFSPDHPDDLDDIKQAIASAEAASSNIDKAQANFYVYIDTLTFTGSLNEKYTVKLDKWLIMDCIDIATDFRLTIDDYQYGGLLPAELNIFSTLTVENKNSITIVFNSYDTSKKEGNYVTTQLARGQINANTNIKAELKVQKKEYIFSDGEANVTKNSSKSGILFRVYSGFKSATDYSDCNGDMLQQKITDSSGTVTFKNLPAERKYCVKELFSTNTTESSISPNDWTRDADCNGKGEGEEKEGSSGGKVLEALTTGLITTNDDNTNYYCNIPIKYCFKIRKKDNESNCVVSGIKFQLKSGSTNIGSEQTTNSSGKVHFSNLSYRDYKYVETSSNGTTATEHCDGQSTTHEYWNSSPISGDVKKEELTEMDRTVKKNGNNITITYTCPADDNKVKIYTKRDNRYHYCVAVQKKDKVTGEPLARAMFSATNASFQYNTLGSTSYTINDGMAFFYLGENKSTTITEAEAPERYAKSTESINADGVLLPEGSATAGPDFVTACIEAYSNANKNAYVMTDKKLLINWYKTNEDNEGLQGARFNVRYKEDDNSYKYVKVKMSDNGNRVKQEYTINNVTKNCYVYDGIVSESEKNTLQNAGEKNAVDLVSDDNGEVCIIGMVNNGKKFNNQTAQGAYTVVETKPARYHTFDNTTTMSLDLTTEFQPKTSNNKFTNYETKFEFTKQVNDGYYDNNQLKKLKFNIKDNNGNILSFISVNGIYEYDGNTKDKPSGTAITNLNLNDNRKIIVYHLPTGSYTIEEVDNACSATTTNCDCVGYYYNPTPVSFEITDSYYTKATVSMTNDSTKVKFTKSDLYKNITGNDKATFENNEEVKAFDQISFKIKKGDKDGTDVTNHLEKLSDGVYRYVSSNTQTTELNTSKGSLIITNLCKNTEFTIVESSVPAHSVFALVNTPSVTFTVNNTKPSSTQEVKISNEPTKIKIVKKDSSTDEVIKEEANTKKQNTAKFNIYRCKANQTCTDTFESSKSVLVKFNAAKKIGSDEKAYSYAVNQSASGLISDLTLTNGEIIIRYLPAGFRYYVIEKDAPDGYYELSGNKKLITFIQSKNKIDQTINGNNNPVSITFTKSDILKYYTSSDAAKIGENTKIFDTMRFKLYDKYGKVLSLKCTKKDGKSYNETTKICESGVYRYIPVKSNENIMTELNTINGTFTITHLYNNQKYYIEEVKSDDEGNFILPTNKKYVGLPFDNEGHPVVEYDVPSTKPTTKEGQESLTQLIENSSTRVVFEKRDFTTNELIDDDLTPSDSTKTTFKIYRCEKTVSKCTKENGTLVYFKDKAYISDDDVDANNRKVKAYKYSKLNSSSGAVSDLHTDKGTLIIRYLPSNYKYIIYESVAPGGYYNPDEIKASIAFTVKGESASDTKDYEDIPNIVQNTPTELYFKKEDLYKYYGNTDIASASNLTKLFDTMRFKLYDKDGKVLSLKCTEKNGKKYNSKTETCESGEYRYLPADDSNTITELNTINGEFKITHLYRNSNYYIEEVKSDDEGIFILPNYLKYENLPFKNNGHPVVKYELPDKKPDSYESVTEVIENIPTRVKLEKRDSKYGYLIDDETTTFNVYSCEKTVSKCNSENGKLVYFSERAVINGDKEDNGIEVYKYSKTNQKAVSDLHPYHGVLILRYLPSKYKYVLVETKSPKGYVLPDGENKNTQFEIMSETTDVEEIDVPNRATALLIKKYSDNGQLLPGAEFKIYEGTTCDANLSAMNQPKKLLKLKTIRDGVYENRPEQDTDTILTCTDKDGAKCSDISTNTMSKLTYNNYINSWANFDKAIDDEGNKFNFQQGEALIQYLEYNHCYIIEETKAPKGYSLPKNDEDRFTMVTITEDPTIKSTKKELVNKPTPFTFYKYDEYNNLLDGAEFKLQKLDSNKKYHDITVTKEETENGVYYKADKTSDNKVITTKDGKATVYYLEEGQYRIVETKAAPGKELGKNPNVATFFVDNAGNVYGNSIIVNKAKTETLTFTSSASAEFMIWNRTGQKVIRYGLIISSLVAVIVALMIMLRIKKKSE